MKEYIYDKVHVLRVKDGDTIVVNVYIDIGFKTTIIKELTLRIKDLDTPETWRPSNDLEEEHGKQATQKAKELLENKDVIIKTYKPGKYGGRYIADITLPDGRDFKTVMINEGFQKRKSYE